MSNSLLEAMACGLPSVVSSAGGNIDLIQDGQAGLVADATTPRSGEPAHSNVRRRLTSSTLGACARRIICQQYSIESIVDRYEALYRQLLAG